MLPVACALALGCADDRPAPSAGAPTENALETTRGAMSANARDALDRLRALGYVDVSERSTAGEPSGVVFHDRERYSPGDNFYVSAGLCRAEVVDAAGNVLRTWEHDPCGRWASATPLRDGGLIVVGQHPKGRAPPGHHRRYLLRLAANGTVVWERGLPVHHHATITDDGRVLALTRHDRTIATVDPEISARDNGVATLTLAGTLIEERSLYELLAAAPDRFRFQTVGPRETARAPVVDLLHTNALDWLQGGSFPGAAFGSPGAALLVCMRHQDTVALIDWHRRRVLWAWGQDELDGPHDAHVLPGGNLLIFDNGLGRGWSRVVEVDPVPRAIVWEYRATPPERFYSRIHGSSQRLANGNTLIVDSTHGRAFEVTPAGELVWDFLTPHRDRKGRRYNIVAMRRHAEPWMAARPPSSPGPIAAGPPALETTPR